MELDRVKFIGLRVAKGMSQDGLATALKVSRPTVAGWEKGTITPKLQQLNEAAAALGVEPEDLVVKAAKQ